MPERVERIAIARHFRCRRNQREAAAGVIAHRLQHGIAPRAVDLVCVVHGTIQDKSLIILRYHPRMSSEHARSVTPPVGAALREAKREFRERALRARDALSAEYREAASRAIADRLIALASFIAARTVLVTIPFRSEWDSRQLATHAL